MEYILLLDSSDQYLSIGVASEGRLLYQHSFYAWQRQSEYMIPEIENAINSLKIELKDITSISLGIGPGSYTGIRIPLTIAKTLNTLYNTPIVPISSLKIMGTKDEKYIALMNARSKRSYIGIYDHGKIILNDQVITNDELMPLIPKYLQQGFVLKGSLEYLNEDFESSIDVMNGLLSYSNDEKASNPMSLCPVYLKD